MRMIKAILTLSVMTGAVTAADAYVPIAREGVKWVYYDCHLEAAPDGVGNGPAGSGVNITFYPVTYEFVGDTVFADDPGVRYLKLWEDRVVFDRRTGEVTGRTHGVVAYASTKDERQFLARRNGSTEPLVGIFRNGNFLVYNTHGTFAAFVQGWDEVPLTRQQRQEHFAFSDRKTVEVNGTQRVCFTSTIPGRQFIEGIGFVITDWAAEVVPSVRSFFDLNPGPLDRLLSHVEENGVVVFKGERYDFIRDKVYDYNGGSEPVAVDDLPGSHAVVDGRTYDIQGRVVTDTDTPGIYVRDGKKVAVTR